MAMQEGRNHEIEYITWGNEQWKAKMENLREPPLPPGMTSDPNFTHCKRTGGCHDDVWIQYIADNGTKWAAKCHVHTSGAFGDHLRFTFEHFRDDNLEDADHEDDTIRFRTWDGSNWELKIPARSANGPIAIDFDLHKV
jgi:hypothetical protein